MAIACFCGLVVFLLATYFNPYMNAVLGISFYSITVGCFTLMGKLDILDAIRRKNVRGTAAKRETITRCRQLCLKVSGEMPKISIAMTTYNGESFVEVQLQSILDQKRPAGRSGYL